MVQNFVTIPWSYSYNGQCGGALIFSMLDFCCHHYRPAATADEGLYVNVGKSWYSANDQGLAVS